MSEQNRLRVPQVRAARHDRVGVRLGLRDDRVDETQDVARDRAGVVEHIHPHERRDLVVAAAPARELAAELGPDLAEECGGLECAVHVLVAGARTQSAVLDAPREGSSPACIVRSSSGVR